MRLRAIPLVLALVMATPAVAHAGTWAWWKQVHGLAVDAAPVLDPDRTTMRVRGDLLRWERSMLAAELRQRRSWIRSERARGHFVDPRTMRSWSTAQIDRLIVRVFGRNDEALRIAHCESHDNPLARNASGASGVFQLMPEWWAGHFDPFDPLANVRAAS